MSKSAQNASCIQFKREDIALYANVYEPEVQSWLQRGVLENLPSMQIYLATCAAEARNVVKQLLIPKYKAIFIIGSDACFEHFINTYRELSPNPAKSAYLGFIPLGSSPFASRFGLSISPSRLEMLDTLHFTAVPVLLPEMNSRLALRISVGKKLAALSYLPQSLKKQLLHTPLSQALPGTCALSCINEGASACALTRDSSLGKALAKDQVIFNKRVLTLTITPSTKGSTSPKDVVNHYFELNVQFLTSPSALIPALIPQTEAYLCQRVRLDFAQRSTVVTDDNTTECNTATITLCNREFNCLVPR